MSNLKFFENLTANDPKYLVILLHGYGANGENLLSLSNEFKNLIPKSNFISPNAVEDWEGGFPNCYQWFSLYFDDQRRPFDQTIKNIRESNLKLSDFISLQLNRFNLTHDKLILAGFSQGAMMSIYQGLTKDVVPAGIISFSGRVILPEMTGDKIISKPKICLIHGEKDSVVPFDHFVQGQEILSKLGIDCQAYSFANLDHSIDINAVRAAQQFIKSLNLQ